MIQLPGQPSGPQAEPLKELRPTSTEERELWLLESLDMVSALGRSLQANATGKESPHAILEASKPIIKRLINLESLAFSLIPEEGLALGLSLVAPPERSAKNVSLLTGGSNDLEYENPRRAVIPLDRRKIGGARFGRGSEPRPAGLTGHREESLRETFRDRVEV